MNDSLPQIQKKIDDILQEYEKPYFSPLSMMAALSEEVGEVARVLNHKYGDKPKKPTEESDDLSGELADVLWAVICIANSEKVNSGVGIERSIDKLLTRDKDRFAKKK